MSRRTVWAGSFLVTLAVWLWFSWPLPTRVCSAIPISGNEEGASRVRPPQACDQLQLLYYFWLVGDQVAGHTPPGQNPYEFNAGGEGMPLGLDLYFFPFSLIYAAGAAGAGRAFGLNAAGFLSLWLTYGLTWLLTRRYARTAGLAALAALPSILLSYRWQALMGGSPSGMAMAFVPAVLLGLDIAVRDERPAGGVLAGLGALLSWSMDAHTMFFVMLAAPAWCVVALLNRPERPEWRWRPSWRRIFAALAPFALLVGAAAAVSGGVLARMGASVGGGLRDASEIAGYSPHWRGLFGADLLGLSSQIYLGLVMPALLAGGLIATLALWRRDPDVRRRQAAATLAAVLFGISVAVILALGFNGPVHGAVFKLARRMIPLYGMLRQPAKVFVLLPTLLSVGVALSLNVLADAVRRRWVRAALLAAMGVGLAADASRQVATAVSPLEMTQGAFKAVAGDAAARGVPPRAIAIPLWPGDAHATTLDMHAASLYRVRLVNGYGPHPSRDYVEQVYRRFESVNRGFLDPDRIAELRARGIDYVLVREDEFPEPVSPFPVAWTLRNLLQHPRLTWLGREGSVWAFRIEAGEQAPSRRGAHWTHGLPAQRWEAEDGDMKRTSVRAEATASGGRLARLAGDGAELATPPRMTQATEDMRLLVRVRGAGILELAGLSDEAAPAARVPVAEPTRWTWIAVPVSSTINETGVGLRLRRIAGAMDVDLILLTAGDWDCAPAPGKTQSIPAPCFFHAGYTDLEQDTVVLSQGGRIGPLFYGPKLPLVEGRYRLELVYRTAAAPGARLGALALTYNDERPIATVPVIAGQPAEIRWMNTETLPLNAILHFSGVADMALVRVDITRLE